MEEVSIDKNGYIMASLPSNQDKALPAIGFLSHYDTTPDFTGRSVRPKIIEDYDGTDIVLNTTNNIVLSPNYFEDLFYKGQTLITTDGTTLLGADDKAGIAEIITAMEYLIQHPEIPHGKICVAFTPDEEIGRGAHKFDVEKFGADWAYTVDGSQIGELEYENFNAAGATISIGGKCSSRICQRKMVNTASLANQFLSHYQNEKPLKEWRGFSISTFKGSIERQN